MAEILCSGQCSTCALLPGATANQEVNNHITGIFCALGGIPFYCHHKLGWEPGKPGYPEGERSFKIALDNLMAAPKLIHDSPDIPISDLTKSGIPAEIFAGDRARIGSAPACGGWKAAVADLHRQGWFAARTRKLRRTMASDGLRKVAALSGEKSAAKRKGIISDIGDIMKWFVTELHGANVRTGAWMGRGR